jgi:hypothetical protein
MGRSDEGRAAALSRRDTRAAIIGCERPHISRRWRLRQ